jgi:S-adenosylmethionine decarboxylase
MSEAAGPTRPPLTSPPGMWSYAIDVWPEDQSLLTDPDGLVRVLHQTAVAGHAVVLGEAHHKFPNGAVTAFLMLSQSHLSVHTWPEYGSANVDLLTCGRLDGERMVAHLAQALQPTRFEVVRQIRAVRDAGEHEVAQGGDAGERVQGQVLGGHVHTEPVLDRGDQPSTGQ